MLSYKSTRYSCQILIGFHFFFYKSSNPQISDFTKIRLVAAKMAMRTDMKLSLFALLRTRLKIRIMYTFSIQRFHPSLMATS
jgi:hypothetical protein